jgi:hypothetical protein
MIETPPPVELKVPRENQERLRELIDARDRALAFKNFREAKTAQYLQRGRFAWRYHRRLKAAVAAALVYERAQKDFVTFLNAILPDTLVGQWCVHPDTMTAHRQERPRSILEVFGGG